ncbi:MAG: hypothetical protein OXU26_05395, partial [Acidobacteriota bacterium]|nr:hypothetical protein [Acidobacteriota bacterium]
QPKLPQLQLAVTLLLQLLQPKFFQGLIFQQFQVQLLQPEPVVPKFRQKPVSEALAPIELIARRTSSPHSSKGAAFRSRESPPPPGKSCLRAPFRLVFKPVHT